jgi:uncharacterized protein YdgA (DUF945 family)
MKFRYVAVIAGLAIAYPVASWFMGQRVDQYLDDGYKSLDGNPYVRVLERKTERGVFASTATATVELSRPGLAAGGQTADGSAESGAIRITMRSTIKHGPLPGLTRIAAASVHTELSIDNPSIILTKLYGDKPPLTIDTVLGFFGAGHQDIRSPAVDVVLDDQTHVRLGGLAIGNDFQPGMTAYKLSGSLPYLKIDAADGRGSIDLGTVALQGDQHVISDDKPRMYAGPIELTATKLAVQGPDGKAFAAEGVRVATDVSHQDAFIDASISYGFQSLTVANKSFGPSRLDVSLRHLDAKLLADFNRAYMKLVSDPDFQRQVDKRQAAVFKTLTQPLMAILGKSPEFRVDKLEVALPAGKINGNLSVRLPADKIGSLVQVADDPMVLRGVVAMAETDGEIAAPEGLLKAMLGEARAPMLDVLVQDGYLSRQGEQLTTTFKYAAGSLAVNGKPFDPRAFARPPQVQ